MFRRKAFLPLVILSLGSVASLPSARGQTQSVPPPYGPTHVGGYDPIREEFNRRGRDTFFPRRTFGPRKEDRVVKKGLLAPSVQDRADHVAFLKQNQTGLIKLLPREVYDWRTYKTERRVNIRGGGAYYSFFYLSHEYGYGSDLELDHNVFSVGFAGVDYGMIVNLGDVPLENVSETDSRAAFLATYSPARNEPDARCEFKRFRDGVSVDGLLHKRALPVLVNATYLLRSISHGRSDLLVAFRVTRQETDGSVIIAWKLLKEWKRPGFDPVIHVNPVINKCPIR